MTNLTATCIGAHRAQQYPGVCWSSMDAVGLEQIADELCRLLQEQVEVIAGRKFNDFTDEELANYEKRKARILALRAELGSL